MDSLKIIFLLIGWLGIASAAKGQQFLYPVIQDYGGVVALEETILPQKGAKILIDLTSVDPLEDGVNKSLDRVARLINLYALAGIPPKKLDIVVIMHGAATPRALSQEAFQAKFSRSLPDAPLINTLSRQGVRFMVCGQAFSRRGYSPDVLNPQIQMALSAITVLVAYQGQGYSVLYY